MNHKNLLGSRLKIFKFIRDSKLNKSKK